jgi:hypothetical protein
VSVCEKSLRMCMFMSTRRLAQWSFEQCVCLYVCMVSLPQFPDPARLNHELLRHQFRCPSLPNQPTRLSGQRWADTVLYSLSVDRSEREGASCRPDRVWLCGKVTKVISKHYSIIMCRPSFDFGPLTTAPPPRWHTLPSFLGSDTQLS